MSYYDISGLDFLNDSSGSSSGSSSPPSGGNGGGNGGGPHWEPPAPSIDYGFDDSGGFIGEGWGGNPPDDPPAPTFTPDPVVTVPPPWVADPAPVVNIPDPVVTVPPPWVADPVPVVNIPDPVIETGPPPGEIGGPGYVNPTIDTTNTVDVAAEQDAIDDALAIAQANQNPPAPSGPYVPDWGENWVNVSQVGGGPNSPGSLLYGINLEGYGFDPKSEYLPQEFLQSLMEGTVVGEYENIITNDLIESGENWPDYVDFEGNLVEGAAPDVIMDPETGEMVSVVGTWDMIENPEVYGEHPMFPGGLEDYYDTMDENWGFENWGEPGGGDEDYWGDWGGGGQGPAGMTLAEYARQHWFSESLSDVEAKEARREAEGLGPATMSNMDRMFAKDFATEARQPDPFYDPEFSYEMYEDYDPIFAGMDLFQRARG